MQHKDAELGPRRLSLGAHLLARSLNVLLQLLDGILERRPGVIDLIHDQDLLADQVLHLAQARQVEPLGAGDGRAGLLDDGIGGEGLVEGQANGLDGDVGGAGGLQEGPQDTRGHVTTTANGDDEMRLEVLEDVGGGLLAELVNLEKGARGLVNGLPD